MTTITTVFTTPYKAQVSCYVDLLFALAKLGNSTAEQRIERVSELTEAYYEHVGKHADSNVLERLASLILYEELTDPHPDKMTREEYPIMSDSQREERLGDEVSDIWAESVGTDGRDYKLPTRENMRKLR